MKLNKTVKDKSEKDFVLNVPQVVDEQKEIITGFFPKKVSKAEIKPFAPEEITKKLGFLKKWSYNRKPHQSHLVTMWFNNGSCSTFIIITNENRFLMNEKTYILHNSEAKTDISFDKKSHYFFHEDSSMPLNREVKSIGDLSFSTVTPSSLGVYIRVEVVKALVGQSETSKYLRMLVLITAVTCLASIASALMLVNSLRTAVGK
jgi:hypothetical protein